MPYTISQKTLDGSPTTCQVSGFDRLCWAVGSLPFCDAHVTSEGRVRVIWPAPIRMLLTWLHVGGR